MDDAQAYGGRVDELAVLIRALGAGAVLVNTLGVFPAIDAAARAGVPSLWAIHESFDPAVFRYICWGPTGMHPDVQVRFHGCFRLARALIFEARQTADVFAEFSAPEQRFVVDYGVNVDEIDAYRHSVDRTALRAAAGFTDKHVVLGLIGVFEPRKAQAAVVAAFDEMAVVHSDIRLMLVGAHPSAYTACVRAQVSRCASSSRINLMEIAPDVYPAYLISDLFVCGSDIESLPRSILEAMAFELPVVSTDVFGISDLIAEGRTGWLAPARDLERLLGVLHLVLRLPRDARAAVGSRARAEVLRRQGRDSDGLAIARAASSLIEDPGADVAGPSS
jgi:glycosyltransferase involved in cell wall biosynthesis